MQDSGTTSASSPLPLSAPVVAAVTQWDAKRAVADVGGGEGEKETHLPPRRLNQRGAVS
jgi:hypothetical protein